MFHVTIYHLRLKLSYDSDVAVFSSIRPFAPGMVTGFLVHSRVYDFKSSYINRLYHKSKIYS